MLQIVLEQPGALRATDAPPPVPAPGEALVRVHRIGVCGTDLHAFAGRQPFFTYPRVLGHELGVEVVDPGTEPHGLKAGDRCAVEPYLNCGRCIACRRGKPNCCAELQVLGVHTDGGMRPLFAVPARKLHRSERLTYDQLALVETLGIGAHAVERAAIQPDDTVLVIGAGPIGLGVIQFAQVRGAPVAVMDVSPARLEFCRRQLGVAHTLAAGPDAPARLRAIFGGDLPTVVLDATGNAQSMAGAFDLPAPGGRLVFVGLFPGDVTFADPNFHRRELTLLATRNSLPATFRDIIALIEAGRIDTTPWITHRFALADTPARFPGIAGDPAVIKAVIEVPPAG
jgi:2-desacetyl-2-hydroxyethyl bacteriochlorophyllide A dehydrogenase